MQFAKKLRHGVIKIDNQQQRTKIGALGYFTWRDSRIRPIVLHRSEISCFFVGNLAEKASCVDDKTVLFRFTYSEIVFQ